jgi:hypothetical protein
MKHAFFLHKRALAAFGYCSHKEVKVTQKIKVDIRFLFRHIFGKIDWQRPCRLGAYTMKRETGKGGERGR